MWHICCRWQTHTMRCLTLTVLYIDVDDQCDKLVTDDRHQFITLTVHLRWQHLRRSTCSCEIVKVQSLGESSRGKYSYFWRCPDSLPTQCMISRVKLNLFSRFHAHDRIGMVWVVRGHPRSLQDNTMLTYARHCSNRCRYFKGTCNRLPLPVIICYYLRFTLGLVFSFDVSNGFVRDGDESVDCGGTQKS